MLYGPLILFLASFLFPTSVMASGTPRQGIALIVGISTYVGEPPLAGATRDARSIDAFLRSVGFQTILVEDASRAEFRSAITEFSSEIKAGGIGLFYFAGHAAQSPRAFRLLSRGATQAEVLENFEGEVAISEVMRVLSAPRPNKANIVIVDACRDLLPGSPQRIAPNSPMAQASFDETMIVHSTMSGGFAAEGDRGYGLFTGFLLRAFSTPGAPLTTAVGMARERVIMATGGAQVPTISSTLSSDIVFAAADPEQRLVADFDQILPATNPIRYRAISRRLTDAERERVVWETIRDSEIPSDYETFLRLFPDGEFADDARRRLDSFATPLPAAIDKQPVERLKSPGSPPGDIEPLNETRSVQVDANVRGGPDNSYPPVTTVGAGTRLSVLGQTKTGWFQVRTPDNVSGFVYRTLLGPAGERDETPPASPRAKMPQSGPQEAAQAPADPSTIEPQPLAQDDAQRLDTETMDAAAVEDISTWELRAAIPSNSFQMRNLEEFADDLRRVFGSETGLSILPNSQPFASRTIADAVAAGETQFGAVVLSEISDDASVLEVDALPSLATDFFEAQRLWDVSRQLIEAALHNDGMRLMFVVPSPPHGLLVNREITSHSDLNGIRLLADTRLAQRFASGTQAIPVPPSNRSLVDLVQNDEIDAVVSSAVDTEQGFGLATHRYFYQFRMALPKLAVIANAEFLENLSEAAQTSLLNTSVEARNRGWRMSVEEENLKYNRLIDRDINVEEPSEKLLDEISILMMAETSVWAQEVGSHASIILTKYKKEQ